MLNVCQTASACLLTAREMTQRSGSLRELERFLGSDQSQRCCFLGSLLTTCRILNNPLLHIMIFICHISSACHACLCLDHVFYFGETEYAQPFLFLLKRRWFVLQRIWLEAGNIRTFVSWWFSTFWLDLTQMRSRIYMLVMWDKNLKCENNTFFFWSVNLCDNLFAKQNRQPVILPAPPSRTLLRPGSPPTPLYVKERWILLLFNSLWFCCGVLDFMDDTVWMWNPLISKFGGRTFVGSWVVLRSQVAVLNVTLFPCLDAFAVHHRHFSASFSTTRQKYKCWEIMLVK